jgi:tetratricopeptide (TPR) repeat protein
MRVYVLLIIFVFSSMLPIVSHAQDGEDLLSLLKAGEFESLESATRQIQVKFENGTLSEIELRNAFRQFYNLAEHSLVQLDEWKIKVPDSYAAHLIRGTYLKRKGFEARCEKYISETPRENIEKMRQYYEIAMPELGKSLKLTEKPFLSVFHLLQISMTGGHKNDSWALVVAANKMLPSNTLARNRFMISPQPRWGGSYEEMRKFIGMSKEEGVSQVGLMQLEAIMYDDIGYTLFERGHKERAAKWFGRALELAQRVGGEFRKDFLGFSNRHGCQEPDLQKYCAG